MPTYRDMLRARMEAAKGRANESRETLRRTGGQAASPTTFADCADLFWRAAVAYGTASELYTLGETVAGDAWNATGHTLEEAALSCDASASGEIIEV